MPRRVGPLGHKSEVVTVRVTPRIRYGLELMARLHQESIPEVITRAISEAFTSEDGGLFVYVDDDKSQPRNLLDRVWADRPSDRLVNLALRYPAVMSRTEKTMWSVVRGTPKYWRSERARRAALPEESALLRDAIAEDWTAIGQAAGNSTSD